MRIVIAIDSFKGSLTSLEAGQAAAEGVKAVCPSCDTVIIPVADGGEGMQDVLVKATAGRRITLRAHDPLMQLRDTSYGISGDGTTAFIEMASISGLALVPDDQRNPMLTTTYGTGELIAHALNQGCHNFIIGIGGSATNDAGLGMLQALGFRFLDKEGKDLGKEKAMCGALLSSVASIDASTVPPSLSASTFTAACDVNNPFYGPNGAAYVFAPQKGAAPSMVETLDAAMRHLSQVIQATTHRDISTLPGAGAAGGMGGGLVAFLNAQLKPGVTLLLDAIHFADQIKGADLIITGEGKADRQTLMGKLPSGILAEAQTQQIPVILIAGIVDHPEALLHAGFYSVFPTKPPSMPIEEAMQKDVAQRNIHRTVAQLLRLHKVCIRCDACTHN